MGQGGGLTLGLGSELSALTAIKAEIGSGLGIGTGFSVLTAIEVDIGFGSGLVY